MKKFLLYPRWLLRRAEKKLNTLEKDGKHLTAVRLGCLYELEEGLPGEARYIFTGSAPGELGMKREEDTLSLLYSAQRVPMRPPVPGLKLWRVGGKYPYEQTVQEKRQQLFSRGYRFAFAVSLFLMALGMVLVTDTGKAAGFYLFGIAALGALAGLVGAIMTLEKNDKR